MGDAPYAFVEGGVKGDDVGGVGECLPLVLFVGGGAAADDGESCGGVVGLVVCGLLVRAVCGVLLAF